MNLMPVVDVVRWFLIFVSGFAFGWAVCGIFAYRQLMKLAMNRGEVQPKSEVSTRRDADVRRKLLSSLNELSIENFAPKQRNDRER